MARVVEVYPDKTGAVRNVEVLVKPNQDGSSKYKPSLGYQVKRHVSKLLLLVPAEEQEDVQKDDDDEVEKAVLNDDDEVEKEVFDDDDEMNNDVLDDDVCDSMAQSVSSSYNSPDAQKQYEVASLQVEDVDEELGGNVATSRRSPRFRHTNA